MSTSVHCWRSPAWCDKGWSRSASTGRYSKATKQRRSPVTTERLQLTLLPDLRPKAQPLPVQASAEGIELIAMMLVHLIREERVIGETAEVRDECR